MTRNHNTARASLQDPSDESLSERARAAGDEDALPLEDSSLS